MMFIHGLNIINVSVLDYHKHWRNLGSPETFLDAMQQMQTLKKAGAEIAGFSFVFWRDDKRRKIKGPETLHYKGPIAEMIQKLKFGVVLEKEQTQIHKRYRGAA